MKKRTLETVRCNLCGAGDYEVVYPAKSDKKEDVRGHKTYRSSSVERLVDQLVKCRKCGLLYLNPRPSAGSVLRGYKTGADEVFVSQNSARERTFERSLKEIEGLVGRDGGKVFDVGTAGGAFLAVAQRHGWEVDGCEPNKWLCSWAKINYGIKVRPGTIFDAALKDNSFDVVTLWDVLEHTSDPKEILKECYRILKPNGLIVLNIPNSDSLVARLMGRRWVFLVSVHLYYFTVKTLTKLLKVTGFRVVKHKRHWQSLELGYIVGRVKEYSPRLEGVLTQLVRKLRIYNVQVPYWMGQERVYARKIS